MAPSTRRLWTCSRRSFKAAIVLSYRLCPRRRTRRNVAEFPAVPLTLEGSSVLHQMFRLRRTAWRGLDHAKRARILEEAVSLLTPMEEGSQRGHPDQSAVYSQIGHKGDLM